MVSGFRGRNLGFFGLLKESYNLCRKQWLSFSFIAFVSLILMVAPVYLIKLVKFYKKVATFSVDIISAIAIVIYLIVVLVLLLTIPILVENTVKGQPISYKKVCQQSLARTPSAVWTYILGEIITSFLSLLLIIPGIIWRGYYYFALPVVALRNVSGKEALDYSKALVKGNWWEVFFHSVFIILILGLSVFGGICLMSESEPKSLTLADKIIIPGIISLAGIFYMVFFTLSFLNLDYRKNNTDSTAEVAGGEFP